MEPVVEKAWRLLLERHPDARRGDPGVIEAASAEPRLRQLFPFLSHGCLTFHRNPHFPWSNDLPFIACTTPYKVYAAGYAELLGETGTPQEAAALVVAHLPNDCGPAVEGPWPEWRGDQGWTTRPDRSTATRVVRSVPTSAQPTDPPQLRLSLPFIPLPYPHPPTC